MTRWGLLLIGLLGAIACTAAPPSPVTTPPLSHTTAPCDGARTTEVSFSHLVYKDWAAVFAPIACEDQRVHFQGDGFDHLSRAEVWLVGANQGFFPGQPDPPTGIKLGESPVSPQGRVDFSACLSKRMTTASGAPLELAPGRTYGIVVRTEGPTEPMHFSSYHAFTLGEVPCAQASPGAAPSLAIAPAAPCVGNEVTVQGTHFEPGAASVKLWVRHQGVPGWIDTGKEPPEIRDLGSPTIGPDGSFSLKFRLEPPSYEPQYPRYTLNVYDQGQTRNTTLEIPVCAP